MNRIWCKQKLNRISLGLLIILLVNLFILPTISLKAQTLVTGPPSAPYSLQLTQVQLDPVKHQVNLGWQSSTSVDSWQIYRSPNNRDYSQVATVAGPMSTGETVAYTDKSGLVNGMTYKYFVVGYSGNPSAAVTASNPDTAPSTIVMQSAPHVIAVGPKKGATNVGTQCLNSGITSGSTINSSNAVQVVFDEDMDSQSLVNGGITLATATTNVSIQVVPVTARKFAVYPVGGVYNSNTTYTVTVTAAAKTTPNSLSLAQPYSWSFTTINTSATSPHKYFSASTAQCSTCHSSHSGKAVGFLTENSTELTCDICHNGSQANDTNYYGSSPNSTTGSTVYAEYGHGQTQFTYNSSPVDCQSCHDPHSNPASNGSNLLLKSGGTLLQNNPVLTSPDTVTYNADNFSACTTCHSEFVYSNNTPLGQATTNSSNLADYQTATGFYQPSLPLDVQKDLHYLHLIQAGVDQKNTPSLGYSNATCNDCHNPHGVKNTTGVSFNENLAKMVEFPPVAWITTAGTLDTPTFSVVAQESTNVNECTLTCHGYTHNSITYP